MPALTELSDCGECRREIGCGRVRCPCANPVILQNVKSFVVLAEKFDVGEMVNL